MAMQFIFKTIVACFAIFVLDVLIYGELFPIVGLYVGSFLSHHFQLQFLGQVLLVAACTTVLFFLSLALKIEKIFWKRLYSLESFYKYILHARDIVNGILLCVYVASLINMSTVLNTTTTTSTAPAYLLQDKTKASKCDASSGAHCDAQGGNFNLSIRPFLWVHHIACQRFEFYGVKKYLNCCQGPSPLPDLSYKILYETSVLHATAYIVVSVAKMLYYNTLFTYLQTLRIFRDIQAGQNQNQGNPGGRRPRNSNANANARRRPSPPSPSPSSPPATTTPPAPAAPAPTAVEQQPPQIQNQQMQNRNLAQNLTSSYGQIADPNLNQGQSVQGQNVGQVSNRTSIPTPTNPRTVVSLGTRPPQRL